MKIFLNWMHRKLHPMDVKYSQVPQKKGGEVEEERVEMMAEEKEALLLHDMLCNILTIGTLGQYQDPFEEEREEEEHEEAPLIAAIEEEEEEEEDEEKTIITVEKEEIVVVEVEDLPLLKEDKERRERARTRTTLADLFAADSPAREDGNVGEGIENSSDGSRKQQLQRIKKKKEKEKKKKKKRDSNGENNSKLQKVMTRMLKKKIHPESITSAEAAAAADKGVHKHDDVSRSRLIYW